MRQCIPTVLKRCDSPPAGAINLDPSVGDLIVPGRVTEYDLAEVRTKIQIVAAKPTDLRYDGGSAL